MNRKLKIVVAVTGASGSIYARQVIGMLLESSLVGEVAVVVSRHAAEVMEFEREQIVLADPRITLFDNDDMFAPIASGSARYDAMAIVPCSMSTAGRIATAASDNLIGRAADVMLKERRRLVMVVRETPLSTIHLRNLVTLSECGAVILPATPSFYSLPTSVEQLCQSISERVVALLGVERERFEWGSQNE